MFPSLILHLVGPPSNTAFILWMWTSPIKALRDVLTRIIPKSVEMWRSGETDGMKWPEYLRLEHISVSPWNPPRSRRFLMTTISWGEQQSTRDQRDGQMFRYGCRRELLLLWLISITVMSSNDDYAGSGDDKEVLVAVLWLKRRHEDYRDNS